MTSISSHPTKRKTNKSTPQENSETDNKKKEENIRKIMLQTHRHLISSSFPFNLSHHPRKPNFLLHNYKATVVSHLTLPRTTRIEPSWVARAEEPASTSATAVMKEEEGPVELSQSIFATTDDPTPLQVSTSVLLTGAISVFLFRSLRRRAKRAKELVGIC